MGNLDKVTTVSQVFDRFALELIPRKKPKTRAGYVAAISKLRPVFGHMHPSQIKPSHVYEYVDKRSAKISGHREVEVLSSALTQAVRWGVIDRHPFKGQVRLEGEKPRTRHIEEWELEAALSLQPKRRGTSLRVAQAYILVKRLTGLRRADMLRIRPLRPEDDALRVEANKSGKVLEIELTPALRAAVEAAMLARPVHISPWVFCTKRGNCYYDEVTGDSNGWDSLWDRFMTRLLAETEVSERFGDRDLRARAGHDATDLKHAQQLLDHADPRTTKKHYRRGRILVKPVR